MGSSISIGISNRRSAGGKLPLKFWNDDIWPTVETLYDKFSIEKADGFAIFEAFLAIDVDDNGTVTSVQCHDYIGERKTKYTGRIFSTTTNDSKSLTASDQLSFEEFSIVIWNYCSYSTLQLAQQLFEIYDTNLSGELERSDIESMYKMMYDREDHEEWCIAQFPFNSKGFISKASYIKHCFERNRLIQPAIIYQRRVRKKLGGALYWGSVEATRKKVFAIQDSETATLEDSLLSILRFEDLFKINRKAAADSILSNQMLKLKKEEEIREKERVDLMKKLNDEDNQKLERRDDWKMKVAWDFFTNTLSEFEGDYFTTDDVWARQEARLELFSLLDTAVQETTTYWSMLDETNIMITEGSPADHEARLQEYRKTKEGAMHFKYVLIRNVLETLSEGIRAANHFKHRKKKFAQSQQEVAVTMALVGVVNSDYTQIGKLGTLFLEAEEPVARMYGTQIQFQEAEIKTHDELFNFHKQKVMSELLIHIQKERIVRQQRHLRVEHDFITNHGPRLTRWESVINHHNKRRVYVNIDTLQAIHRNSAICERCDTVFEQSDEQCSKCEAKRSSKNGKLYRPFGYQDICVD